MKEWKKCVNQFLIDWEKEDYVLGAILVGSYATGNETENSDIDIHIVLDNSIEWRERGNKIVNGYLIEYFANPIKQIKQYFINDYSNNRKCDANMFSHGRILFDTDNIVFSLKKEAQCKLNLELKKLSNFNESFFKYNIFDDFQNLKDHLGKKSFNFYSNLFLYDLLEKYRLFLRVSLPAKSKVYDFFADKSFQKKYNLQPFPDQFFVDKFLLIVQSSNELDKFSLIKDLKNHVLESMGGFEIDGWKINSKLDV